jgi:hypothetical protein
MFMLVFTEWHNRIKTDEAFQRRVRGYKLLFDKERSSILRNKNNPTYAYAEQKLGCTHIGCVTNSHDSNLAKVSLGMAPNVPVEDSVDLLWNMKARGFANSPYLRAAKYNFDHFRDGGVALNAWKAGHRLAIRKACRAKEQSGEAQKDSLAEALAMNAQADHYGTDQFASGHMRTQRMQEYNELRVQCATALHLEDGTVVHVDNAHMTIDEGMHACRFCCAPPIFCVLGTHPVRDPWAWPHSFCSLAAIGIVAKVQHDEDNWQVAL